jgi:hypothetical protein
MNENRRDDWRTDIESRTVTNTAAIGQLQDTLDDIKNLIRDCDKILRGDPDAPEHAGVLERLHEAETNAQRCYTILFVGDFAGEKGLLERFKHLENKDRKADKVLSLRWQFYGVVVGALILLAREVVHDLPSLESWWNSRPESVLNKQIDNVKHPKPRHHHIVEDEEGDIISDTKSDGDH